MPSSLETVLRSREPLAGKVFKAKIMDNDDIFKSRVKQILAHLENPQRSLDLPLDIQGTAFQRLVWTANLGSHPVPPQVTRTSRQKICHPKAARAVAQACASNKIAVAIPCHRAVRRDGRLGGYRWGIERKCGA